MARKGKSIHVRSRDKRKASIVQVSISPSLGEEGYDRYILKLGKMYIAEKIIVADGSIKYRISIITKKNKKVSITLDSEYISEVREVPIHCKRKIRIRRHGA